MPRRQPATFSRPRESSQALSFPPRLESGECRSLAFASFLPFFSSSAASPCIFVGPRDAFSRTFVARANARRPPGTGLRSRSRPRACVRVKRNCARGATRRESRDVVLRRICAGLPRPRSAAMIFDQHGTP